jgi:hypothetical protein
MKKLIIGFLLLCVIASFYSCFIGAGTHGSIASWEFNAPKDSIVKIINSFVVDHRNTDKITMLNCKDSIYFVFNDRSNYYDVCLTKAEGFKVYTYRFTREKSLGKNISEVSLIYTESGAEAELSSDECDMAEENFEKHFINHIRNRMKKAQ